MRPTEDCLKRLSDNLQAFFSGIYTRETVQRDEEPSKSMLQPGPAKKVTIHLNEDTAATLDFLYNEIFSFLFQRGVAGATVVRPVAGFGSHHRVHGTELGATSAGHMPVRIEFIESAERVDELMPNLCELVTDGLIEAHETTVYKAVAKRDLPV